MNGLLFFMLILWSCLRSVSNCKQHYYQKSCGETPIFVVKEKDLRLEIPFDSFFSSAHKRFKNLALEKVGHNRNAKLPMDKLLTLPELRANPFGERMCLIFSSTKVRVPYRGHICCK